MLKNPCRDCPNRFLNCHSSCKDYIDWKKEQSELKEKERLQKVTEYHPKRRRF
jgi:hypothetical protein